MVTVYVIKSSTTGKYYKGMCQNIEARLNEHNRGKTKSTKNGIPWKVVYKEAYDTWDEARKREKYLKSAAGRRSLKTIL